VTPVLLAALLAVLAIRVLQVPQVRTGLGATAAFITALTVMSGHGAVLIAAATALAAAVLGPVLLLHRFVVPVPARTWRAS
jgi:hypothetical protein